jgi:dTDP-4-amino-4,6-dideoxygalactose transaminase
VADSEPQREAILVHLAERGIMAVFHYVPLHKSDFYLKDHEATTLIRTERWSACLLRLPFYFELTDLQTDHIIDCIKDFYNAGK